MYQIFNIVSAVANILFKNITQIIKIYYSYKKIILLLFYHNIINI